MTNRNRALLGAAVAGIVGAAAMAQPALAAKEKNVPCYGVNACKGHGSCKGSNDCKGKNGCKTQGWVPMPESSCEAIGGSTTPPAK